MKIYIDQDERRGNDAFFLLYTASAICRRPQLFAGRCAVFARCKFFSRGNRCTRQ